MTYARKNKPNRKKHFAATNYGKILKIDQNTYSECNHPIITQYYKYAFPHAEFQLFKNNNFRKSKTVYIIRMSSSGKLLESKPCNECMKFLKDMKVKRIIFSTNNGIHKQKIQRE